VFVERHSGQSLSNFRFSIPAPAHLTLNSHRIISFTDPHPLTTIESYRYKNRGGRVYRSGSQLLLLSILNATVNNAESTLLQVFFLKNLKPFEITTYEKPGEGSPLWLTNCSKRVSARKDRWIPSLPSSVPSSKFRIPQVLCLPARRGGPLLRKHPAVWGYFSHSGTLRLFSLPPEWSYGISFSPFAFPDVRTFRPSDTCICRW